MDFNKATAGGNIVKYTVFGISIDPENGELRLINGGKLNIFDDYKLATAECRRMYDKALHEMDLEDNGACDPEGNSMAGGYFISNEASGTEGVIYNHLECENGCLSECAFFTVQQLH
jgi:hypothetical protein